MQTSMTFFMSVECRLVFALNGPNTAVQSPSFGQEMVLANGFQEIYFFHTFIACQVFSIWWLGYKKIMYSAQHFQVLKGFHAHLRSLHLTVNVCIMLCLLMNNSGKDVG
jgi:hypothetical protein